MSTNDEHKARHRKPPAHLRMKGLVLVVAAACLVAWGILVRKSEDTALRTVVQAHAVPTVKVISPVVLSEVQALSLPGTLQAYYSATVYSRVSGYLKRWRVDIGAEVKAGQVLAEIETPELDQQLIQSRANLDTAIANEKLTKITSDRWKNLLATDSVSKQEADEKQGDNEAKRALVEAARADVERLRALQSFKQIVAPFDGVVTARKTDIGALVNAGHDAGHELFTVADVHKLRAYVNVPQLYSSQIGVGMKAHITLPGLPGKVIDAVLTNNSRAVSEDTDAVLIQLDVDNADRQLMPGSFIDVNFDLPADAGILQVPASALIFRKDGLMLAVLGADNRVTLRSVKISRDLGTMVEIAHDLSATDRVIDNPPDSLETGDLVQGDASTTVGRGVK